MIFFAKRKLKVLNFPVNNRFHGGLIFLETNTAFILGPHWLTRFASQSYLFSKKEILYFGPSGVRALPVAAGTNVVAPIVGIIFLLSL